LHVGRSDDARAPTRLSGGLCAQGGGRQGRRRQGREGGAAEKSSNSIAGLRFGLARQWREGGAAENSSNHSVSSVFSSCQARSLACACWQIRHNSRIK